MQVGGWGREWGMLEKAGALWKSPPKYLEQLPVLKATKKISVLKMDVSKSQ